jgi:peptidoglycan/xylan/chitin deacetylase (PgdA/CDA1 family)
MRHRRLAAQMSNRRPLALVAALIAALAACGNDATPPNGVVTSSQLPTMPETSAEPIISATPATAIPPPTASAAARALHPPPSLAGAEWTHLPTTTHVVALTFDAGGNDAGVASILATLAAQHVPATFFITGHWVQVYPAEAKRIASAYAIGNHTLTHPYLTALSDGGVEAEVTQAEHVIATTTGHVAKPLFRFPYGDSDARTLRVVQALGYGGIRWTVDTLGWQGRSAGQSVDGAVARVLGSLAPGEIVLMHVGSAQDGSILDADALSRIISALRERGYGFAAVADFAR